MHYLRQIVFFLIFFIHDPSKADTFAKLSYTTEEYPPFNYSKDGAMTGLSVEMLRLIWKELDVEPQRIHVLPWARAFYDLQRKSDTVLFATVRSEERKAQFQWACPITEGHNNVLLAHKKREIKINSVHDLANYRIGSIRHDFSEQLLMAETETSVNVISNVKMSSNLEMMDKGRVDLIAYDQQAADSMLLNNGYDPEDFETVYVFSKAETCFAFSRGVAPALVQRFQWALDKVIATPEYKKLTLRFFPD